MKKIFLALIILVLAGCSINPAIINQPNSLDNNIEVSETIEESKPATTETNNQSNKNVVISPPVEVVKTLPWPATLELKVAFVPQAPFGNWDELHQETCEEASMIMADRYIKGEAISEQTAEDELQKLVKWQTERGYKVDLTVAETIEVLNDYFGISAKISNNVTIERIKSELASGNLIIIPAAGRKLKNPNFKVPGPIYHMLVIKGYDNRNFITNDPGTRKGNGYKYPYQIIIDAVHDWNHFLAEGGMTDAEMEQGAKAMIIVEKP